MGEDAMPAKAAMFLQLRNVPSVNKVVKFLASAGEGQGSKALQMLALKISEGGPFDKVLEMIRDMIAKLKQDTLEETEKNGVCKQKMETNAMDIEQSQKNMKKNKNDIEASVAKIERETAEKEEAEDNLKTSKKEVAEATQIRRDDKAANDKSLSDANVALDALDQALTVLREFYNKASEAEALVQVGEPQVLDTGAAPETWTQSYQGQQRNSMGVIGMLENVQQDFLNQKQVAESDESKQSAAFTEFKNGQEQEQASLNALIGNLSQSLADTKAELEQHKEELNTNQGLLDTQYEQKKTIEQVEGCLVTGSMTPEQMFEKRQAARKAEMDSLKQALDILTSQ